MPALKAFDLRYLLIACALIIAFATPQSAWADSATQSAIARIERIQGDVHLLSTKPAQKAVIGMPVGPTDRVRTGTGARAMLVFTDGTRMIIGENAEVAIDRYSYQPEAKRGIALFDMIKGAFRFTTGKISKMREKRIEIRTRAANLAVRGTDFWVGPLKGKVGVLLLSGELDVRTSAGSVTLKGKQAGTTIAVSTSSDQGLVGTAIAAPTPPARWTQKLISSALSQAAFN